MFLHGVKTQLLSQMMVAVSDYILVVQIAVR